MKNSGISFYYKNVSSEIIGEQHGISPQQFEQLAAKTSPIIEQLNQEKAQNKTPYRNLPYNEQAIDKINSLADKYRENCEYLVILGIGGSALGNIALQTALNAYTYNFDDSVRKGPKLFIFDNVDPQQFGSFLNWIQDKLDKTIFNVISKSGRTPETAAQFLTVRQLLLDKLGPDGFRDHVIATTDPQQGTLRKITNQVGFDCLQVPDGVGGRFSVLSDVGLFSAAMCGIDIKQLLKGAADMDERVSCTDFFKNPAAINAAINYHYYNQGKKNSVMFSYSYALKDFADWYRQLWAESLGKTKDLQGNDVHIGPTPINALGTTDQHSQVQLYREGPNDKLFTFLEVENFGIDPQIGPAPEIAPELNYLSGAKMSKLLNSEKLATEYALILDKRPCMTVKFDEISPYTVGQFIYFFEVTTSFAGALFNINTYDQPAVELGKEATFALMGHSEYQQMAEKIKFLEEIDEKFLI